MSIRTLDFAKFVGGTERERHEFATSLLDGFVKEGFVKVVNHGFSKADLDQLLAWNKDFFDLPPQQKQETANLPGPHPQRGWSSLGVEKTGTLNKPGKTNLLREHFDIGPADDAEFPNKWPDETVLPGFRPWLEEYFNKSQSISLRLMEALEIATEVPPKEFINRCHGYASELRLNHYPAISVKKLQEGNTNRIWPHTDFGIITLLVQDSQGGLEIQDKNNLGTFVPVQRQEQAELIVNIGDTLERWTNGVLKAGLHQVTIPSHLKKGAPGNILPSRYSVAFFLKASRETSVGPLDYFVLEDRPAMYDYITALAYQERRTGIVY
ncbi:putative gibberellin 20-oxidase [Aspergillus novoparasiticus]|uniref:Putative gibberellin 20-oxidase n=1 Tax=Aspergillus novoparasiticus TaxID=986946 RepID=A0A5N6EPM8_9EURO|nr:putative gibberellin 20-oxidase [Aspergillus novoparasiticus]